MSSYGIESCSIVCSDDGKGGSSDFVAGFVLGGAVFGTLAYVFAPQVFIILNCFLLITF